MRLLLKLKQTLGIMSLILISGSVTADPRIISTYQHRATVVNEDNEDSGDSSSSSSSGTTSGSSGGTTSGSTGSSTGNTGSSGNSGGTSNTTGSTGSTSSNAATAYTIPNGFNFNCATRNPNADAIENGRRAFVRLNCTVCHASTGHGGTMGPSLVGAGDDVAEAVTQGEEGGMPSFKKYLCPNDIADLQAYVNSLGSKTTPTFTDWWVATPPAPFADSAP